MGAKIQAITFDWFGTLATHREGKGRGRRFRDYLASSGMTSAPWDRGCLYPAFEYYADAYRPELSVDEKLRVWTRVTEILFDFLQVKGETACQYELHAPAIRDNFGSSCFELFADVEPVLRALKKKGLRLALISNWHRGLDHFCAEMNLAGFFDAIITSADVGVEKPAPRIFVETVSRLGLRPDQAVHVGDILIDDVQGAASAGLRSILIDRDNVQGSAENRIQSLYQLEGFPTLLD